MKNSYTHLSIVLDRSGSMAAVRNDTIGGFNQFLKDQQAVPGECTLTFVQFDSHAVDTLMERRDIHKAEPLNERTYVPRGRTPLWDAIAKTILATGQSLKELPEHDRPGKVVFMVMTDGEENHSREFTAEKVREMVKTQTDAYKWQFVFLGANIDSYATGQQLGASVANTMNYAHTGAGTRAAYASAGRNLRSFRGGQSVNMAFSATQREEQEKLGADNTKGKTK